MSPQGTPRGRTPDAASAEAASIADRTLLIQTVAFVGSVVPVFFVFLRILGRRMRELRLGPDDYLILAALIPQCFYLAFMSSYSTRYGYGVHIWDAPPLAMLALAQTVFVAEIGYALVFTLTKLSMFAIFYRTIGSRPHALPFIQVLICLVLVWCLIIVSITVLQCVPPRAWWDRFHPDHPMVKYRCWIDTRSFLLMYFFSAYLIDFFTLLMPMPFLFTLRLQSAQLFTFIIYYLLGLAAFGVSTVKLYFIRSMDSKGDDPTYNLVPLGVWMMADTGFSLICANWPFFIPALDKLVCGSASTAMVICFRLLRRIQVPDFIIRLLDRGERPSWPVVRPESAQSSEMTLESSGSSGTHTASHLSLPSPVSIIEVTPWSDQPAGQGDIASGPESNSTSVTLEDVDILLQWAQREESDLGLAVDVTQPPDSPANPGSKSPSRQVQPEQEPAGRLRESHSSMELTEMTRLSD